MSATDSVLLFLMSIGLVITASIFLYKAIIKIGAFFQCPERFLGLTAAFAADAAEILSSFTSFHIGQHELGFGIILGSNIFNLASMLGLSALLIGTLKFNHQEMLLHGTVSFLGAVLCALLILGYLAPWHTLVAFVLFLIPYFLLLSPSRHLVTEVSVTPEEKKFLKQALKNVGKKLPTQRSWKKLLFDIFLAIVSLFGIYVGCQGVVHTGVRMGEIWNISIFIIGFIIIAILTSIPNMATMIPFAFQKREMALISGALNSNTLNILLGICLPSIFYGVGHIVKEEAFAVYWLLAMTAVTLLIGYFRKGLSRLDGILIIALYFCFLGILFFWK